MAETNNLITSNRFDTGFVYQDYISQINVNQDRFEQYYGLAADVLTDDDVVFFKKAVAAGASKVLVLGEDWCPDVYRGMPVIARISESSGMNMKVFPRDNNLDIMDEFLKDGEHRSIPVFVFYTDNQEYLCHWIERPALATEEMAEITTLVEKELEGQSEEAVREARRERVNARFSDWQKYTILELRKRLSEQLGI